MRAYPELRLDKENYGRVELVTQSGISTPKGLTVDANGYFYIPMQTGVAHRDEDGITRSYNKILRISPDGKRYSDYYTQALFEFEGVNVTADCSNNLLFALLIDYPFKLGGEENILLQLVGDTGEVRQVLYGPSIDPALSDIDVLFYDRFGRRFLIWTDLNQGKIFSFPVICGGLDADVHLVTRSDVDISGMTPAPNQSIDRGDGTFEYVWALKNVDNRGTSLQLDLWMQGLTENETRPIAQDAFVEFHNSFVPGQRMRTPLAIPTVLASTAMARQPSLDATQYGPQAPVGITVDVENKSMLAFTGELRLSVVDAAGALVQALPPIAVTDQPGLSTVPYPATWNTGLFLAGGYQLQANLLDADGRIVASGSTAFTLVHDPGAPVLTATLSPDKLIYAGWDSVSLDGAVANTAGNVLLEPTVMTVTVKDPSGAVLYTGTAEVGELAPGGALPVGFGFTLADAPSGLYTVEVRVTRALDGTRLDSFQKTFAVVHTALQGLAGTLTATPTPVAAGTPVDCRETVENRSTSSVDALRLSSVVVSLDSEAVISENHRTLNLAGGQTDTLTRSVDTAPLPVGDYACLLRATLNGTVRDLAAAAFKVTAAVPPIDLHAHLEPGARGRLLVLVDPLAAGCAENDGGDDAACAAARAERAYLDAVLKVGGWTYTRVDTAPDFAREFHSGAYRLYAVLSAKVKLAESLQKELREAVYHGAGLLVGGDHDQRNNILDEALGLQYVGQSPAVAGLRVPAALGYEGVDRSLTAEDRVLRVRPLSATVLGQFTDLGRKAAGPAVTHQGYGRGEAAYLAFDLLAEGAATEPAGTGEFSPLLLNLLDDLAPAPEYRSGDVLPIRVSLTNAGIAVQGWIDLALGGGATVHDAGGAVLQADGRLRWEYVLAAEGSLERLAWTRLPATGTATADARIFVEGRTDPYATLTLAWPVAEVPALESAQLRLDALAAANPAYRSARQSVQRAAQALAAGDLDQARAELVRTAEALIRIGTAEAADLRQAVDEALRRVELPVNQ
jgi:hypothetical protein